MIQTRPRPEDVAARAHELYAQQIKAQVEPQELGRYIAIDVNSGRYAVGEDLDMVGRDIEEDPNAFLYIMRVGGGPAGRIGAAPRPATSP